MEKGLFIDLNVEGIKLAWGKDIRLCQVLLLSRTYSKKALSSEKWKCQYTFFRSGNELRGKTCSYSLNELLLYVLARFIFYLQCINVTLKKGLITYRALEITFSHNLSSTNTTDQVSNTLAAPLVPPQASFTFIKN